MFSLRSSFLTAGALALAIAASAQSTRATSRPNSPAPPRADAPGAPINPRQTTTSPGTNALTNPATPANQAPAAEPEPASPPLRDLNFAEADADGDKRVTLTEFANYVGNRPETRSTEPVTADLIERFRQLDRNGDATLTEAEATATPQATQQPAPQT